MTGFPERLAEPPASPTLFRPPPAVTEIFPDLNALAGRLHALRAGRLIRLSESVAAYDARPFMGWTVHAVAEGAPDEWLGVAYAPGPGRPDLRGAMILAAKEIAA